MDTDHCWGCDCSDTQLNGENLCEFCASEKEQNEKESREAQRYRDNEEEKHRQDWSDTLQECAREESQELEREKLEKKDKWNKIRLGLLPLDICAACGQEIYLDDLSKQERREIYKESPRLDGKICCPNCRDKMLAGQSAVGNCSECKGSLFHEKVIHGLDENP